MGLNVSRFGSQSALGQQHHATRAGGRSPAPWRARVVRTGNQSLCVEPSRGKLGLSHPRADKPVEIFDPARSGSDLVEVRAPGLAGSIAGSTANHVYLLAAGVREGQNTILKFLYAKENMLSHARSQQTPTDTEQPRSGAHALSYMNLTSNRTDKKADEHDIFLPPGPMPSIVTQVPNVLKF